MKAALEKLLKKTNKLAALVTNIAVSSSGTQLRSLMLNICLQKGQD